MGEKDDDGLGLGLSLRLGCGENEHNPPPLNMHKPPLSAPNLRGSYNNLLFHFHDRSSEARSSLRG
ncbi:homeobox associated leucine zipper protein [Spatholobus suberectus]|nr:homeobox associated leucine zipper protein [Spatholobus suberectus]